MTYILRFEFLILWFRSCYSLTTLTWIMFLISSLSLLRSCSIALACCTAQLELLGAAWIKVGTPSRLSCLSFVLISLVSAPAGLSGSTIPVRKMDVSPGFSLKEERLSWVIPVCNTCKTRLMQYHRFWQYLETISWRSSSDFLHNLHYDIHY